MTTTTRNEKNRNKNSKNRNQENQRPQIGDKKSQIRFTCHQSKQKLEVNNQKNENQKS